MPMLQLLHDISAWDVQQYMQCTMLYMLGVYNSTYICTHASVLWLSFIDWQEFAKRNEGNVQSDCIGEISDIRGGGIDVGTCHASGCIKSIFFG